MDVLWTKFARGGGYLTMTNCQIPIANSHFISPMATEDSPRGGARYKNPLLWTTRPPQLGQRPHLESFWYFAYSTKKVSSYPF